MGPHGPGCRRCQCPCGYGYVIIHTCIHGRGLSSARRHVRHAVLPHGILPACTVSRPPSLLAHQELLTAAAVGRKAVRRPRDHNVTPPPTPPATPRHPLSALLDSHGALLWLVLALRIACPSTESRSGWYNPPEGGGARRVIPERTHFSPSNPRWMNLPCRPCLNRFQWPEEKSRGLAPILIEAAQCCQFALRPV